MDRFWNKVEIPTDPSHCWLWVASQDQFGYGRFRFEGKNRHAHRVAWILLNGDILKGLWVLHRCDNPQCVNPGHLFLGTAFDNNRDMFKKGRQGDRKYDKNGRAKITKIQAIEIKRRRLEGEKCAPIAKQFGLSEAAVSYIGIGKNWKGI